MKPRKQMILLGFCLLLSAPRIPARGDDAATDKGKDPAVALTLGALRIMTHVVELRCEVHNATEGDIWIYAEGHTHYDLNGSRGTNAELFTDKDGKTLLILRRTNLPYHDIRLGGLVNARYARLAAGHNRAESFLLSLPVAVRHASLQGLDQAANTGIENVTRLAFEIGYYTTEDLDWFKTSLGPAWRIEYKSPEQVVIREAGPERAVTMIVEGVSIPYTRWYRQGIKGPPMPPDETVSRLDSLKRIFLGNTALLGLEDYWYAQRLFFLDTSLLNDSARRIIDLYVRLAEEKLEPAEFRRHLDGVMKRSDREDLLQMLEKKQAEAYVPKVRRTTMQVLEDLFYEFRLDAEEYRYAQRLFAIDDDSLDEALRQMADVYRQVAREQVDPGQLTQHLNGILSRDEREKLLESLERKQSAAPSKE